MMMTHRSKTIRRIGSPIDRAECGMKGLKKADEGFVLRRLRRSLPHASGSLYLTINQFITVLRITSLARHGPVRRR